MVRKKPNPLSCFSQHGVRFVRQVGTNHVADCPFCSKEQHFYANPENKTWDCKSCGRSGGFQTFLREVIKLSAAEFAGRPALELSRNRGIRVSTLRRHGVGYNPMSNRYVIAIPYVDRAGGIWDVRYCALGRKLLSTASCQVGLFGWELLEPADRVWLCEGEWDAMVVNEALYLLDRAGSEVAVAVPGAATLKLDWLTLFDRKHVCVAYDNDGPGRAGAEKARRLLTENGRTSSLRFVRWPADRPDGYDVRDMYGDVGRDPKALLDGLEAMLAAEPIEPAPSSDDARRSAPAEKAPRAPGGDGLLATDAYASFQRWLHLPDAMLIDVVFGAVIANRLPDDPLWLFIVAEPGGTKTVPLMALSGAAGIVTASTMTPSTLISGASLAGGIDPSLLARFHKRRGDVLVMKDFTAVLGLPQHHREEIFGVLRDAFDGVVEKLFGNGIRRRYEGAFGILAGVTPAVEGYLDVSTALGPRFVSYRIPIPAGMRERRAYVERAQSNVGHEVEMRAELAETSRAVLDHDFGPPPEIPKDVRRKIVSLAQLTSMLRGVVSRDRYTRDVTAIASAELGTRLVKQLTKQAIGVSQFRREDAISEHALEVSRRIAAGSIPQARAAMMAAIWREPDGRKRTWSTKELSAAVGLPDFPTGRRVAQDLSMLGALKPAKSARLGSSRDHYVLSDDFADAISESMLF